MIITDRFVYVHVPRTAGTVIEEMFATRYGLNDDPNQHGILADVTNRLSDEVYSFGFVRNPYAQEYSTWELHCVETDWPRITFDDWISWRYDDLCITERYHFPDGHGGDVIGRIFNINPSAGYFTDVSGERIATDIFRYEQLEEAWDRISNKIEMDMRMQQLPLSERYKAAYNNRTFDLVTKFRDTDISTFGYNFDGYDGCIPDHYNINPIVTHGYHCTRTYIE